MTKENELSELFFEIHEALINQPDIAKKFKYFTEECKSFDEKAGAKSERERIDRKRELSQFLAKKTNTNAGYFMAWLKEFYEELKKHSKSIPLQQDKKGKSIPSERDKKHEVKSE